MLKSVAMLKRFVPIRLGGRPFPFHPWIYFSIFLAANTFLSFADPSAPWAITVAIGGILLPLAVGIHSVLWSPRPKDRPGWDPSSIPWWLWVPALSLLFFSRLYRLDSFPFWPLSDEGQSGFFGIVLSRHWRWDLLLGQERLEPLLLWMLGSFFKWVQPSLFSMRLATALLSLLTCGSAYWAARQYLRPLPAFILVWLLSFSFWMLTHSRTCMALLPISLIQFLCLGLLGKFLKDSRPGIPFGLLCFLGGLGFYAWIAWGGMWVGIALVLAIHAFQRKKGWRYPVAFAVVGSLVALPLVAARWGPGEMDHYRELAAWPFSQVTAAYFYGTFWKGLVSFPFGSSWGGFLNPLLDSLLFLGFLQFLRTSNRAFILCGLSLMFLTSLPGILTVNIDLNRLMTLYPLLTVLALGGLQALMAASGSPSRQALLLGGVLALHTGLDGYNYVYHYGDPRTVPSSQQWRNVQYYDAYRRLDDLRRREGPLYVFSHFNTDYDNKTLEIADYPFNVLENPGLASAHPRWVALITNIEFAPFLLRRFPGTSYGVLRTDRTGPTDPKPYSLFFIPACRFSPGEFAYWVEADRIYADLDFDLKNKTSSQLWESFLMARTGLEGKFKGDRFLSGLYWYKMGFYKFLDVHFIEATRAYEQAIVQGVPAAHFYQDLGLCYQLQGRKKDAERSFRTAAALYREIPSATQEGPALKYLGED